MVPENIVRLMSSRATDFPECASEVLSLAASEAGIGDCAIVMRRCSESECTYISSGGTGYNPIFDWLAENLPMIGTDLSIWDGGVSQGISWMALGHSDLPVQVTCLIDDCYGDFRIIAAPITMCEGRSFAWGLCDSSSAETWRSFLVLIRPNGAQWDPSDILKPLFTPVVLITSRWFGLEPEGSCEERRSFGMLLRRMAHDFNNTFGIILGNLEMALEDELPPDAPCRYSLEQALTASERAMGLTRNLSMVGRDLSSTCTLAETLRRHGQKIEEDTAK